MASTPRNNGVPTPPPTANTQSIGPLGSLSCEDDDGKVVPRKQVVSLGVLGLGDAAVQLRHPDLRLRRALPGLRQLPARRRRRARRRRSAQGAGARRAVERLRPRHDAGRRADPAARAGARPARRRDRAQEGRALPLHRCCSRCCSSACSSCRPTPPTSGSVPRSWHSARSSPRSPASTTTRCCIRSRPVAPSARSPDSAGASATSAASSRSSSSSCSPSRTGSDSTPRTASRTGSSRSARARVDDPVLDPDLPQRARGARRTTPSTARSTSSRATCCW